MDQLKISQNTLKEIGGLLGAVDGNYIEKCKELIQQYNLICWKNENLIILVRTLIDKLKNKEEKEFFTEELKRILNKT